MRKAFLYAAAISIIFLLSCHKESLRIKTATGFFSFKERHQHQTSSDSYSWTFDSVEVITSGPDTYRLRFILDGVEPDSSGKFIGLPSGNVSILGQFSPKFVFDPSTDTCLEIYNSVVYPSNGRAAVRNTFITSRYDAQNQMYYLHYILKQPGFNDWYFYDTLTKLP